MTPLPIPFLVVTTESGVPDIAAARRRTRTLSDPTLYHFVDPTHDVDELTAARNPVEPLTDPDGRPASKMALAAGLMILNRLSVLFDSDALVRTRQNGQTVYLPTNTGNADTLRHMNNVFSLPDAILETLGIQQRDSITTQELEPVDTTENTYTYDQVHEAVNRAANAINELLPWDETLHDIVNLTANVTLHRLEHPDATLDQAIRDNYTAEIDDPSVDDVVDEVKSWIGA